MKKLLLILLLVPTLLYSQVSSWRNNPPQRTESPRIQQSVPQRNDVSGWRTQTEPIRPGHPVPDKPLVRRYRPTIGNPYGLYYGAWGWYQPYPYFWYDNWGYRNRGVVRIYENGKRDTIKTQPIHFGFGIQKTGNKELGGFVTIGTKEYFIAEYNTTYETDNSQFFPYGRIQNADFPIVGEYRKSNTIYLGAGKLITNKTGLHLSVGFGKDNVRYKGRDALGYITFPKYQQNFTTIKIGLLHRFKKVTGKYDYDPIRKFSTFGVGLQF